MLSKTSVESHDSTWYSLTTYVLVAGFFVYSWALRPASNSEKQKMTMVKIPQIPFVLHTTVDIWRAGQILLPKVERWSKFPHGGNGELAVLMDGTLRRRQDDLQHSYSITLFGSMVMARLHRVSMDRDLLHRAFLVHDWGEGERGKDVFTGDRTVQDDVEEYWAFERRFRLHPTWPSFQRAFLLQFVRKYAGTRELAQFPSDAACVVERLTRTYRNEAAAFEFIEKLDYLLYALEQWIHYRNPLVLIRVLNGGCQPAVVEQLCKEFFALRMVWTREIAEWAAKVALLPEPVVDAAVSVNGQPAHVDTSEVQT